MLSRRGLLLGLLATPAIVRAPSLMPISVFRERPLMRVSGLPAIYSNGFVRQFKSPQDERNQRIDSEVEKRIFHSLIH